MKSKIIIAPHPDDEIIGCYEQLIAGENLVIIYSGDTPHNRREKAVKLKEHVDLAHQLFLQSVPQTFLNQENRFYFPDPIYETHPKHREWGMVGEQLARNGLDVIFYTTIMNAPYIHETDLQNKRDLLNKVYPDQKSLWEYDHRYFLYEGYCKWVF